MAVDFSIENFAFALFRGVWQLHGKSYVLSYERNYPKTTVCSDEISDAVFYRQHMSRTFYTCILTEDYKEFSTSRSDFHFYFTSRCRHLNFKKFPVMEKVLASATLIAAMGLICESRDNDIFVRGCPLSWAMYFDSELKDEFYQHGGWAELQKTAERFRKASAFLRSFPSQLNVCEELLIHMRFYASKLLDTFDNDVFCQWSRLTSELRRALIYSTNVHHLPRFDSPNFEYLVSVPMHLTAMCATPVFNFIPFVTDNKLSPYVESLPPFRFDILESLLQGEHEEYQKLIMDFRSGPLDISESRFFKYYRKSRGESSTWKSKITYGSEISRQDRTYLKQSIKPEHGSISTDKACVSKICRQGEVEQENKNLAQSIVYERTLPLDEQSSTNMSLDGVDKLEISCQANNLGARPKSNSSVKREKVAHSPHAIPKQTGLPDDASLVTKSKTNPIFSATSDQSVCEDITNTKALSERIKKQNGKKKKPLQTSVPIKLKNLNDEAGANTLACPETTSLQDDLDVVLENVLVLGVPFDPQSNI